MNKAVEKIKQSIEQLPERERKRLTRWILKKDAAELDRQMNADAAAGKLQFLIDEPQSERKTRRLLKFP